MTEHRNGDREIRAALAESRRLFVACGLFSMAVNVLMLTGPLFMLQIYDRVLGSRSEATLVTLAALVAFLFLLMGVLDHARGRVLARVGARLQERLDPRVLRAILVRSVAPAERSRPATGLADLEAIQRFASSSGAFTFFDAPWTPVFLFVLFLFHWMLGVLAVFSRMPAAHGRAAQSGPHRWAPAGSRRGNRRGRALHRAGARGRRDGARPGHAWRGVVPFASTAPPGPGPDAGRFRSQRAVRGGHQDAAPVPAVDDARPRRLAGAAWRGITGNHDRRVDPAGAGAGPDRSGGRLLAAAAAGRWLAGGRWGSF